MLTLSVGGIYFLLITSGITKYISEAGYFENIMYGFEREVLYKSG